MHTPYTRWAATLLLSLAPLLAQGENLTDIYRLARDNDPTLRAAEASRLATAENRPQAVANLLPTVTLSASSADVHVDKPTVSNRNYDTSGYGLSLTQAVFHYDYLIKLSQADAQVAQSETLYRAEEQSLITRVAEAYFNVLTAIDNLEFRRKEKAAIGRQLEQASKRFEVGLIAITDVHEAQASYDLVTADEIAADDALASAREALATITGQFHEQLSPLGKEVALATPEPADLEQWTATALEKNLTILAAQYGVESSREQIRINRAGHLPTVDLTAGRTFSDSEGSSSGGSGSSSTLDTLSLSLSVPLFSGGATSSKVRQASHQYTQALEELEAQRRTTRREARDAYRGVTAAISRVEALKQALVSTRSALEATEAGFEVGTRTIVDVLNSQRDLYRSLRDYDSARYDYLLNTLRLKQAAGTLTVADLEQVSRWLK